MNLNDRFAISQLDCEEALVTCDTCGAEVRKRNAELHNEWHNERESSLVLPACAECHSTQWVHKEACSLYDKDDERVQRELGRS